MSLPKPLAVWQPLPITAKNVPTKSRTRRCLDNLVISIREKRPGENGPLCRFSSGFDRVAAAPGIIKNDGQRWLVTRPGTPSGIRAPSPAGCFAGLVNIRRRACVTPPVCPSNWWLMAANRGVRASPPIASELSRFKTRTSARAGPRRSIWYAPAVPSEHPGRRQSGK